VEYVEGGRTVEEARMGRLLMVAVFCVILVAACGGPVDAEKVCELNDEFAALNERTLPNIDEDPFPEPALLEENFVEGIKLMRSMVEVAPDEIRVDLTTYVESIEKTSDLYAQFGYDRQDLWANVEQGIPIGEETYVSEYTPDQAGRKRIHDWFMEHCGLDLQG
jgi:hypothetical protein